MWNGNIYDPTKKKRTRCNTFSCGMPSKIVDTSTDRWQTVLGSKLCDPYCNTLRSSKSPVAQHLALHTICYVCDFDQK